MSRFAYSIFVVWVGLVSGASASLGDETLIQRIKTDGCSGWRAHERMVQNITATVNHEQAGFGGEDIAIFRTKRIRVRYASTVGAVTTSERTFPIPRIRGVITEGRNSHYAFDLINGEITLVEFGPVGLSLKEPEGQLGTCFWSIHGAYSLLGRFPLSEMVDEGRLSIKSAREIHVAGRTLVNIHCTLRHDRENCRLVSGASPIELTFDPSNGWAIQDVEFFGAFGVRSHTEFLYVDQPLPGQSLRHIARTAWTTSSEDSPETETDTNEFEKVSFDPIDPKEFSLSAFGLPEPVMP